MERQPSRSQQPSCSVNDTEAYPLPLQEDQVADGMESTLESVTSILTVLSCLTMLQVKDK